MFDLVLTKENGRWTNSFDLSGDIVWNFSFSNNLFFISNYNFRCIFIKLQKQSSPIEHCLSSRRSASQLWYNVDNFPRKVDILDLTYAGNPYSTIHSEH